MPLRFRFALGFSLILASCAALWLPPALHWWLREQRFEVSTLSLPPIDEPLEVWLEEEACDCGEGHSNQTSWYLESGFLAVDKSWWGPDYRLTLYGPDGQIFGQSRLDAAGVRESKTRPPWWWGVTDRTEATAPWVEMELTFEDWRVLSF